jgi:putative membrane protein
MSDLMGIDGLSAGKLRTPVSQPCRLNPGLCIIKEMTMKTLFLSAAVGLMSMGAAWAQDMTAQEFVNQAASGGLFEVQSSELALERSQSSEVQEFANQMITDHTANNQELMTIVQAENLTMPTEVASPHAEMMQTLQDAEGEAFDTAYVQNQATAHETAVTLYQTYAEGGDNEALMAYAQKSLPVLQQHLEHAQGLGQ